MDIVNWKSILEALLFAAGDEGLSLEQISSVMEVTEEEAKDALYDLKELYQNEDRGICVVELAGVYQLATKKVHAPYLKKLVETPSAHTLSQASLETLAIIAYKQPITRIEIEAIRGVKTERPLQTLMAKALIQETGRAEGAGRPYLYGTTKEFLDYFGLKSLDELPALQDDTDDGFNDEEADLFFHKFQEME
ncbi:MULTISPECIES: SMC-Scp complex subunit ScpB [unclassified Bacillus (in: firmicutes)]|uniref:SMC-Scp complex subunit ScpB n=1 Tax=unclassified Bacillus (in: firmicutes) TaxID=185979 RepID=UPI00080AE846|nr:MULTISPECIES: SMC-Scp complex subunit ScpB [unclassified Bacillus (in: firmicutes)]OCA83620.1 SMC-Scp complex subunit ScpB [Bacillus sp. FJAT-27986]